MMKPGQNLLIDADDTLWHNNVFFEKGIKRYVERMEELGFPRWELEPWLRRREVENVAYHGYGSVSFTVSLTQVYHEACDKYGAVRSDEEIRFIKDVGRSTREYPIKLLPGVRETLPVLKDRHRLLLVTKGRDEEQQAKVQRSGLSHFFERIIVVPEKNREVYHKILQDHGLEPDLTWMVGNSQKSDINPAKEAGMRTVLIPYHATWEFEKEEIIPGGSETIILKDFSGLQQLLVESGEILRG